MFALLLFLVSSPAFAYQDGTYTCKNLDGLPNNVYKVQTMSVGGASVPYLDLVRHYRQNLVDPNSKVLTSHIKGLATLVSDDEGSETLQLGAIHLDFDPNGGLINCKQ